MKELLAKEFRLAAHPTSYIFLLLSFLMIIPNYPYYVTFFYTSLAVYFTSLSSRENGDMAFMLLLPIRKRDAVKARFLLVVAFELMQAVLAIPAAMLRASMPLPGNMVGMDANIALFGLSFIMLGIFNLIFMTSYYKHPDKIGKPFAIASAVMFLYMAVAEVCAHAVPFVRDRLDTPDPQFLTEKLITLALGLVIYVLLTLVSYRRSAAEFEKLDL